MLEQLGPAEDDLNALCSAPPSSRRLEWNALALRGYELTNRQVEDLLALSMWALRSYTNAQPLSPTPSRYGAGQDLLVAAPSGNIRGAGPGVADFEFDHTLTSLRPAESFMLIAASAAPVHAACRCSGGSPIRCTAPG
jgi:hypothetical protein